MADNSKEAVAEEITLKPGEIPTPTKEGYVFSHWSLNKPGSVTRVRDKDNNEYEIDNDCPPFNFEKEVITSDITLYAIFIPKCKVTFKVEDETVTTQDTIFGGKAYDPTPAGVRSPLDLALSEDVSQSHNKHKITAYNKNTGKPRIIF